MKNFNMFTKHLVVYSLVQNHETTDIRLSEHISKKLATQEAVAQNLKNISAYKDDSYIIARVVSDTAEFNNYKDLL